MHSRRFHIENVGITTHSKFAHDQLLNLGPIVTLIAFVWAARVVVPLYNYRSIDLLIVN